ncbi:hypothetical protein Aasi_1414 [Candidatus Amoebophilus asiaticus 5a2]|uniref:Insecticidal toxin complex protein n=1 Tax=Amoebophilus asiaticus (strain 5a2) TaxID=452471 RepID=B3EU05_AMOA5|nr:SpvB/TcaC N-terminal domain-containing protein [Candidatus Amoebophilus asiaticus]ACE06707.1 hypothetical protein Aasi_1414 [Candidatus Amoebophilus asiaticus 5a2]
MNKELENQTSSSQSQFLKTDRGKTKSNTIEIPSIALPKGGGAIKGIDEKFSVNAVNGTASFTIPLPFSQARSVTPSLSLAYNSGGGNGVFGLGWAMGLASIKRKTDKELPQYFDAIESDTFLFSEAEDLVPVYKKEYKKETDGSLSKDADGNYIIYFIKDAKGNYVIDEKDSLDRSYTIRFYKPRIEGLFAHIEKWTHKSSREIKWRVITRENVTTLFGWSVNSRIADPNDMNRVFEWLPEFVFDDKGNCSQYIYKKEDKAGFDHAQLHNCNRFQNEHITYTNLYLEKILYGNKTPYKSFHDPYPKETDYLFQTLFDYGEYNPDAPYNKIKEWDFRKDAFSDYKPGFEIRTARLCKRVLLFHHFDELHGGSALVRSLNFEYDTATEESFTFLKSITAFGYIKQATGNYTHKHLPATEFIYQKHEWNPTLKTISFDDIVHAPSGLDEPSYQFIDLFNEGLSGILTEQGEGWYYKHNLGGGKFEQAKLVAPKPSFAGLGNSLQLMDLDADGGKQLVSLSSEPKGFFELNDEEEWQPFRSFDNLPNINLADPNTRMLDLNGDGRPEVLITEDHVFTWYESVGRKGFKHSCKTVKPFDEEEGPHIVFAEPTQTIFLADMSGDGMSDIVRIRNNEVCYWPNLGYGKFGAKVSMDHAPVFDQLGAFDPAYLRLADIDGSGTTDIIYLGKNTFTCWMNLSGNAFSRTPFEIDAFPEIHNQSKITVTDILGNGVACIVWSSNLPKDTQAPLKYIDLMSSKKPHIMVGYKNNLGKEVSLKYTPSTQFYLEDKRDGKPWVTKLHFPVHCISEIETRDTISGYRFVNTYKYHHGYYDHAEREFRGFGMVEQTDAEHFEHWVKGNNSNIVDKTLHQEPVITKSWFHTGAFLSRERILNQFEHEYWYKEMIRQGFIDVVNHEHSLPDARLIAAPGLDNSIIKELSAQEWQEAVRACKSMALRSEIFAKDAPLSGATPEQVKRALTPYSVATHNCVIELLQPKGQNKHAVFVVKESEAITYSYERNTAAPRIAHNLNIQLDEYGNVLESASVVYPRLIPNTILPSETQQEQRKPIIIYTQNKFTNDKIGNKLANDKIEDDMYRLRLPSEVKTFQLKEVKKAGTFYAVSDFENILTDAKSDVALYHELDKPLLKDPLTGEVIKAQRRLIEHIRTTYYNNNLKEALPLHTLDSLAFPFESYQLAYTPDLLNDIFRTKVDAALMEEGKFTHSEGDNNWWIRSGTTQFIQGAETASDSQNRFYVPISYTDPYGAITKVKYYGNYFLFIEETEDALGNKTKVDEFNFRTLSPKRMQDPNENFSEVLVDELGLVKAMAICGKVHEENNEKVHESDDLAGLNEFTDPAESALISSFLTAPASNMLTAHGKTLLQHATARFVYDFDVYKHTGKPVVVASIVREEHFKKKNDSPIQLSFEYSNGLGQVVMRKVQAELGLAKQVTVHADNSYSIDKINTAKLNPQQLRWIGNGRTVLNNKGNPVKQYEPYFSVTHQYEDLKELVETGVTPLLYYDAMGRMIKTEMPDGTFTKTEFDSWQQSMYDQNDTVLESSWYHKRFNRLIDDKLKEAGKDPIKEKQAAEAAAKHAHTPNVQHFDTLGRPVLSIDHNKKIDSGDNDLCYTHVKLDAEGNLRSITDDRKNTVMQYKYDMLGSMVYQNSMDAGQRWLLTNIMGNPLRTWDDERNHEFQYFYDILHRPTSSKVLGGDGNIALNHIFDRIFYGDEKSESNAELRNVRGRIVRHYDTGGLIHTPSYDFKGQPPLTTRKVFRKYKEVANWIDANLATDLEADSYDFTTETDALGRITRQTAPDGSIITPSYNEAGLLNSESVTHANPALTTTYIKDIDYNEKGQRNKIIYGNDVTTKFYYDEETFRITRLESKRKNNDPLQDWYYTYDPVGNITHIEDKNIPVVFFNNQKITGISSYTYDALYRLVEATGRENNAALTFGSQDNWNDAPFKHQVNVGDPIAVRNYTQRYQYDPVGNILQMKHVACGNNWTRNYTYEAMNNRLIRTQVGSQVCSEANLVECPEICSEVSLEVISGAYTYPHHAQHGYMIAMPHLEDMGWNFKEEVVKTIRQRRTNGGTPETTYYQYDGQGQRIRKLTENQADAGAIPTKKEERIYIAGYEIYKKHSNTHAGLERTSLSLMDEGHRFVMIETRNDIDDGTEKHLVRYQLHNHLGSAALELDDSAQVISYEEYHPYGTTAYQANNAAIKAAAKRYRYTGMERDEETGLEYHSARYYVPWLGRWCSADPIGIGDGVNVYRYVGNNPVNLHDPTGALEFENYDAYKAYVGNKALSADKIGSQGHWLKSDRENKTDVWSVANTFNLQQKDGNLQYTTITQRVAFYGWFQKQIEAKGFETKWAGAAYIIAQQMSLMDDKLVASLTDDQIIKFANEGNKAIFDDVFDNLRDLYNGPVLKGDAARKWNEATLTHEQRDVVQPIYARQTPETIKTLQSLAEGTGWKATLGLIFDRRFPIGGPLKFSGDISNWQDRYAHGMNKAVPFYNKYGSLFNWNKPGDDRLDSVFDPDNPSLRIKGNKL